MAHSINGADRRLTRGGHRALVPARTGSVNVSGFV